MDPNAAAMQGRVLQIPFTLNTDVDYRAYTIEGMKIRSKGLAIRDGGWVAAITDPNGVELSDGSIAPAGSILLYGFYNIDLGSDKANDKNDEELIMQYQSLEPMVFDAFGAGVVLCEVISSAHELPGVAQGYLKPIPVGDTGLLDFNTRTIITFPVAE